MLARIIYPVESEQVVKFRKRMVLDDLQKTYIQESTQIHNKYQHIPDKLKTSYFAGKGSHEKYVPTEERSVLPLDAELTALRKKNQEQIDNKIGKIVRNHRNKMNKQNTIAMNISRLSPASCYTYLVSGLSNTGPREFGKFTENAQEFQDEVKKAIYDNYERRATKSFSQTTTLRDTPDTVPDMHYRYANMAEILEAGLVDVILSIGFTFLFFTMAFVTFNRYDVRP